MNILAAEKLSSLFEALQEDGFRILGPTVDEAAIVYDELESIADLPIGQTDEQEKGYYRLKPRDDNAFFGFVVGPQSWKKYLHPPKRKLWSATRTQEGFDLNEEQLPTEKLAFVGVRSCELEAILKQDHIFLNGRYKNQNYEARRKNAFIVAVNCTQAAPTCFCTSMGTGPKARGSYDLSLTEIISGGEHYFVCRAGSSTGEAILQRLPVEQKQQAEDAENSAIGKAVAQMREGRKLQAKDIKELLYSKLESARWDEVAKRCLSCANCTMVCPTCFCTTVEDVTDLQGENTERWLTWDSCFNADFSYLYGGSVRASTASRYRQWLTHKLASWQDQFGSSGCVGCGRCITWCPVGIDLTEEVKAFQDEAEGVGP